MTGPWTGTHDDRPDWDRPRFATLLGMIALSWGWLGYVGVWLWRRLR